LISRFACPRGLQQQSASAACTCAAVYLIIDALMSAGSRAVRYCCHLCAWCCLYSLNPACLLHHSSQLLHQAFSFGAGGWIEAWQVEFVSAYMCLLHIAQQELHLQLTKFSMGCSIVSVLRLSLSVCPYVGAAETGLHTWQSSFEVKLTDVGCSRMYCSMEHTWSCLLFAAGKICKI